MLRSLIDDVQREFRMGNMVTRLVIVNIAAFVVINLLKLGFTVAVVPKANLPKKNDKAYAGLAIHGVERIEEAMHVVRGLD